MAEKYPIGVRQISYRAGRFKEGVTVTMKMCSPSLAWTSGFTFTEIGEGLYYFDFNFSQEGVYRAILYEDGVKTVSQNFLIHPDLSNVLDVINDKVSFVKGVEGGRWKIVNNQMIFFDEDNTTELMRFNLFDKDGKPTEANVVERTRVQ